MSVPHILVLGDIMLDHTCSGVVERVSPEAPVPVLKVQEETFQLGGAANVAANIKALGVEVSLWGALGHDHNGNKLRSLIEEQAIEHFFWKSLSPTTTKLRASAGQQLLRLDFEEVSPLEESIVLEITRKLEEVQGVDLVVFSDYAKGIMGSWSQQWIQILQDRKIPVLVDPKMNWQCFTGAAWITPNWKEFSQYGKVENIHRSIVEAAKSLCQEFAIENILITRSAKGMSHVSLQENKEWSTQARDVFDVSGAGDTVVATLAMALASGFSSATALRMANIAAGIAVSKRGTVQVSRLELEEEMQGIPSVYGQEEAKVLAEEKHRQGQSIVFTNGCFDLLHRGHLQYLKKASQLGDVLWVGLNSDSSIRKLKGSDRPVNGEADRALLLSSLEFVDAVFVFSEDTPEKLLQVIRPHFLVKGGDYQMDEVIGAKYAKEVRVLDFVDGFSTTQIISKLKEK